MSAQEQNNTPEERLDQVFLGAFGTNHPAMLDWVNVKFDLKKFKTCLNQHEQNRNIRDGLLELFRKAGWSEDCTLINQLSCMNFDSLTKR